ncbi:MAG: Trk system potassium transporter TrkA [Deltaproteobacteria bacterium]|jgi:trk system potassium uptake protein TrkA|nr:Trk system potassium transporter TrkA [Deltaproteobacteria bacterium]
MKIIVAGAGEVGYNIAERLSRDKVDVVLIDVDQKRLEAVVDSLDVQTICGSASHPVVLKEAGLEDSDMLVAVTSSDEINVLACRMSQLMAPEVRRAARIRDQLLYEEVHQKEELKEGLGLSFVIDPSALTVDTILDYLDLPGAVDVINVADGRLKFVGLRLSRNHPAVGKALAEVLPRTPDNNLLVVAIYRHHEVLIPSGATVLKGRDLLYMAATPERFQEVAAFFEIEWKTVDNIFIMGGGEVGLHLAKRLEERDEGDVSVKLIEQNAERCEFLSRELKNTIVLRGDATDQSLLEDEGIAECDVFIAVGADDEKNMVTCLLAKRLGAANTITRVNRYSYAPLVSAIGLESLVSARVAAVSAILQYIHKGLVVTVATLQNEDAEVAEITVAENSRLCGLALRDSKFPAGSIVAGVLRGDDCFVPRGDTVLEAGDVLAVVARSDAVHQLTKIYGK